MKPVPSRTRCVTCDGAGQVPDYGPVGMDFVGPKECPDCRGAGFEPLIGLPASVNGRALPKANELWQHYTGNKYRVITVARHSEIEQKANGDGFVVVYARCGKSLESTDVWSRPLTMFMGDIDPSTPRFSRFRQAPK